MVRSWLFALVFGGVVALSLLIAHYFVPDYASIEAYRVREVSESVGKNGHATFAWSQRAEGEPKADQILYVPTHEGGLEIDVNGQRFGQSGLADFARISRRKIPTALDIPAALLNKAQPDKVRITRTKRERLGQIPAVYLGPATQLAPVVERHFTVGPAMRAAIPMMSGLMFLFTLAAAFLSRSPARYLCMAGVFALQLGIELDDQIWIGSTTLRSFNAYMSLFRDLMIFLSFNLWFEAHALHRKIAIWTALAIACFYIFISATFGSDSGVFFPFFAIRTLLLCGYCIFVILNTREATAAVRAVAHASIGTWFQSGLKILGSEAQETTMSKVALALFGVWMTSNLTYLSFYSPTGEPSRDFLAANYVNVSMVLALSLLVFGAIAVEWGRYRKAVGESAMLGVIVAGHRLELNQRARDLQQEIERRAIVEERQRFTRDMHDGIGGQLLSLLLKARKGDVDALALERDIEQSIHDLRLVTASLDGSELGLSAALESFKDRSRDQLDIAGMRLDWRQSEAAAGALLGPRETLELLRILQEAMTNAIRHSGGDKVTVTVDFKVRELRLKISFADNGQGITHATAGRGGLRNIQARINKLDGVMEMTSDGGLRLDMDIPCQTFAV